MGLSRGPGLPLAVTVAAALAFAAASCGARTELFAESGICQGEEVRTCENACGFGQQRCVDGLWGGCEVPRVERPCTNDCGRGTRVCQSGRWLECETPEVSRPCEDACGTGASWCREGDWGPCEVPVARVACMSVCGSGEEICERGSWRECNAPQPRPPVLVSVVRDFLDTHPDFEEPNMGSQLDLGLVEFLLGPDDKPVYTNKPNSVSTSGAMAFDQWYRDVPSVNRATSIDLQLQPSTSRAGLFVYENRSFFPIDGQLFGNQGRAHNYHFTLEASTQFQYLGGEEFRFRGDDDMWVFINRRLALDLGGVHVSLSGTIDLDAEAARLELTRGETYPLHFFFAERKTIESNFTIETSISEPGSCD
ncbi:MAG TPA: fibro-slime domain-containing protein [Polyangiaceae bacterium]